MRRVRFFTENKIDDAAKPEDDTPGASLSAGWETNLSGKTKLLADSQYNFTFDSIRLSSTLLSGWKKFRLKIGAGYFMAENDTHPSQAPHQNQYGFAVLGLWWRFYGD